MPRRERSDRPRGDKGRAAPERPGDGRGGGAWERRAPRIKKGEKDHWQALSPRPQRRAEVAPDVEREAAPAMREERGADRGRYVYGINPVLEALRAHADRIERLFVAEGEVARGAAAELFSRARDAGVRVQKLPRERLAALAGGGVHQGVVAELREFEYAELGDLLAEAKQRGEPPLVVVLDGVQDPHNLGAIIRSAHALGAHGVVVAKDRAASVTGLVAKASAGATEHAKIARVTNLSRALEELKDAGLWIAAAEPEGNEDLWSARLDGPLALVIGGEGPGVRPGVLGHCDFRLRIPMAGAVASLNASVAAGLLLYEVCRQRAQHQVKAPSEAPHPTD